MVLKDFAIGAVVGVTTAVVFITVYNHVTGTWEYVEKGGRKHNKIKRNNAKAKNKKKPAARKPKKPKEKKEKAPTDA